jgi:hypothetical protein
MDDANMDWTVIVAEHKIQAAMEAGEFRNVPGSGMPLDPSVLSTSVFERYTGRIMRNSGVLPEWIQLHKDIEREVRQMEPYRLRALQQIRKTRNPATRSRVAERLRSAHRERVELVNTLILKYNMNAPLTAQRLFRTLKLKEEVSGLEEEIETALREAAEAAAR